MTVAMKRQRIRVLFFERGENGGSVLSLSKLLQGLTGQGCGVAVVSYFQETAPVNLSSLAELRSFHCLGAPPGVRPRPEVGTHTLGIPHPTMFGLRYLRLSLGAIRQFRPDVVYLNTCPAPHLPALAAARILNVPVVCHLRAAERLTRWDAQVIGLIRRFVVLTQWGRRFFHAQGIEV